MDGGSGRAPGGLAAGAFFCRHEQALCVNALTSNAYCSADESRPHRENRTTRTKTHPGPPSRFALKPRSVRPALSQAHQPSYEGGPVRFPMGGGALDRAGCGCPLPFSLLTLAAMRRSGRSIDPIFSYFFIY
jgi:hypothetical protein